MKILIVSSSDLNGGAARAAYRLHKALLNSGVDSFMLVQNKTSDDATVIGPEAKLLKLISHFRPALDSIPFSILKNNTSTPFSCAWLPSKGLIKKINEMNPDIVHLHWINSGMLKIEDVEKINAKIVWTLHDMWPFSGGWHYDEASASSTQKKLDRLILKRKKKAYSRLEDITIVGVSRWIQKCAKESSLLYDKNIVNLPNPIDCITFSPSDKVYSRNVWRLPHDKKLILFGAMGATSDPRKGFDELVQALSKIKDDNIELVVFGASAPKQELNVGFKVHYMGVLRDDVSLVTLYSAVDVMLVPSRQEAFGQTASEAMACGTPVVAFGHTGLLDIVDHKCNGYLAKPLDTQDLANGIDWILKNENYNDISSNARRKVVESFSNEVVSEQYESLYRKLLNNTKW